MGAGCSSEHNAADKKYQPQEQPAPVSKEASREASMSSHVSCDYSQEQELRISNVDSNGTVLAVTTTLPGAKIATRKVPRSVSSILKASSSGEKSAVFKRMSVKGEGSDVPLDHLRQTLSDDRGKVRAPAALAPCTLP